ncbi:hypothetical protein L5515_007044 [Caenorhabditis briggsae]|uniref:Serpentine Receptor, class BC (Class B-like) n=1 Tax=Caenorhabditis briggsae TaxID=6238 RepID=A0AAE9JIW9_CAEBR|nr:hypothetical protein L5515_007044 [Caenorhabditis briggsae]
MLLPFIVSSIGVVCGVLIAIMNCFLIFIYRRQPSSQSSIGFITPKYQSGYFSSSPWLLDFSKTLYFLTYVILSTIVFFSTAFCVRLFLWSKSDSSLTQANRLAIIDAVTTFFCQFIPPFCVSLWPDFELFQFSYAGPFNLVGKLVGNTIESALMFRIMRKKYVEQKAATTFVIRGFSHGTHSSDHHRF